LRIGCPARSLGHVRTPSAPTLLSLSAPASKTGHVRSCFEKIRIESRGWLGDLEPAASLGSVSSSSAPALHAVATESGVRRARRSQRPARGHGRVSGPGTQSARHEAALRFSGSLGFFEPKGGQRFPRTAWRRPDVFENNHPNDPAKSELDHARGTGVTTTPLPPPSPLNQGVQRYRW
jgi:hypothetical protein